MTVYTLFSQAATGTTLTADPNPYTMGVQFSVSQSATLTAIWFYSPSGATVLPQTIALYAMSGASLVHSEPASWSGAAGSGWVRAAFATPPSLTASASYKAAILQDTSASFYSHTAGYWDAGAGSGGITNGPLSAPNNAGADHGQDSFHQDSVLAYPDGSFNASNYWVDPEVTTGGTSHTATAALTVTPSFSAARVRGKYRTGALAVTPSFSAARTRGKYRTGSLLATPSFSAARLLNHGRHASLTVTPAFSAARTAARHRTGALILAPSFSAARTAGHARHAALALAPSFRAVPSGGATAAVVLFSAGTAGWAWGAGAARNE